MNGRTTLAALVAFAVTLPGCNSKPSPSLVVATSWPPAARLGLEFAFRKDGGSITWVGIDGASGLAAALGRWGGVDLILGGPASDLVRLVDAGRLEPIEADDPTPWRVIRRPGVTSGPAPSADHADPRDDPATLDQIKAILERDGWTSGYRTLVRRAALARPSVARTSTNGPPSLGGPSPSDPPEVVALVRDGSHGAQARRLLELLEAGRGLEVPRSEALRQARADGLLADLLGAALIDARSELQSAEAAIRRSPRPEAADLAFGDRPPWPPTSVAKLQGSGDRSLIETLVEQLATDPEVRVWLLASWAGPKRAIDGAVLDEIAGALEGRVSREPRFRAWLRAEWAAWHRQLYRRVARVAGGYIPS